MKFVGKLLMITVFVMLLAMSVHAIAAFIQPPKLVYTVYVEEGRVNEFPGSIKVKNINTFPVTVIFDKPDWVDMVGSVQLQPDEEQDVLFTIVLMQSGTYNSDISATYTASGHLPLALSAELTVNAIYNGSYTNLNPPDAPQLLAPGDGSETHDKSVTLQWSVSNDPDGDSVIYNYFVDDNSDFSSAETGSTSGTQLQLELSYDTYYWKIVASDGEHEASSAVQSFSIVNNAPTAPGLVSPEDNASIEQLPLLEWSASSDADGDSITYEVLVDDNTNFNVPFLKETTTNTQFNLDNIDVGIWYWKVKADDGITKSESQTWSFTLGTTTTTTIAATTTTTQPPSGGSSPGGSSGGGSSGSGSATTTSTTTTVPTTTTTLLSGTTTTTAEETTTTTTTPEDAITVSILRGPSNTEFAIITLVIIGTAIGAVYILRR